MLLAQESQHNSGGNEDVNKRQNELYAEALARWARDGKKGPTPYQATKLWEECAQLALAELTPAGGPDNHRSQRHKKTRLEGSGYFL